MGRRIVLEATNVFRGDESLFQATNLRGDNFNFTVTIGNSSDNVFSGERRNCVRASHSQGCESSKVNMLAPESELAKPYLRMRCDYGSTWW